MQLTANPLGHRYCSDNAYIGSQEDVPALLEKSFTTLPTSKSAVLYFSMNPTSQQAKYQDNAGDGGMALSMQSDHYFSMYCVWEDERDDDRCYTWVQDCIKGIESHSPGSYLGDTDFQLRRPKFWADGNTQRLMDIRRKWDPDGRICGYLDKGDTGGVDGL